MEKSACILDEECSTPEFKRGVQVARAMPTKEEVYVYTQLVQDVVQQRWTRDCKASKYVRVCVLSASGLSDSLRPRGL